jgi:hypothetical protein
MTKTERLETLEKLFGKRGWDADSARKTARDAVEKGEGERLISC